MGRFADLEISRRKALQLGLYAGAASLAWACGTGQPSAGAKTGGKLVFAYGGGPTSLDPLAPGLSSITLGWWRQLYDTLVWADPTGQKFQGQLATSWKMVSDTVWEFKLRQGVKFHNGEPFDANSVKYTIDRILDPNQKSAQLARVTEVSQTEVVDSQTVRIHTKNPFPVLLLGLTQAFIVPAQYTAKDPSYAAQHPVGTGPFKFLEWKEGDHMSLAANTDYWQGRPKLDKLTFRVIPDDSARLAALKAGEIHIDQILPLDAIDSVATDPNLTVQHAFIEMGQIIELDYRKGGPLADVRVRQALNYAVNKDEINKTILLGKERPLDGQLLTQGVLGYNSAVKAYPYDPTKAKQLLSAAGYSGGFDLTMYGPIGKYTGDRDILTATAAQLQQAGVRAKAVPMEYGAWVTKLVANELSPAFYVGWYSYGDPALAMIWLTSKSTEGNFYSDPTYDSLVFKGAQELDHSAREQDYLKASQYMHDQAMAIYMFQPADYWGVSKKVKGFVPRDDEIDYLYNVSLEQ